MPDLVLVASVGLGLKRSWRKCSCFLAISFVVLFYGMLALNGKEVHNWPVMLLGIAIFL